MNVVTWSLLLLCWTRIRWRRSGAQFKVMTVKRIIEYGKEVFLASDCGCLQLRDAAATLSGTLGLSNFFNDW